MSGAILNFCSNASCGREFVCALCPEKVPHHPHLCDPCQGKACARCEQPFDYVRQPDTLCDGCNREHRDVAARVDRYRGHGRVTKWDIGRWRR